MIAAIGNYYFWGAAIYWAIKGGWLDAALWPLIAGLQLWTRAKELLS